MRLAFHAPRAMLDNKPPYGSPCTRCGLCCVATLCPLAQHVFNLPREAGPCLALVKDDAGYHCGIAAAPARFAGKSRVVRFGVARLREAALKIIGAGDGCDARFNGEPRDPIIGARFDALDKTPEFRAALRLWGIAEVKR